MDAHGKSPAVFVNNVKRSCGRFYGTAGPAYPEALTAFQSDWVELARYVRDAREAWLKRLMPSEVMLPERERSLSRLAPVLVAGKRAVELGILPIGSDEVFAAVRHVREAWLNDITNAPAALRGVINVCDFIQRNRQGRSVALDKAEFEELALRFAGTVVAALTDTRRTARTPSRRDERRVAAALHRIERHAHEHVPLADLARGSATSPYHFLRIFQQVVGMTPYQFVLRTRLHRAAVELRRSDDNVAVIALNAGFNDVSEFNRRFKRITGLSPSAYCRSSSSAFA